MASIVTAFPPAPHRFNSAEVTGDPAGYQSGSATYRGIPVTGFGILLSRAVDRPASLVNATPAPSAFQSRVYNRIFVLPMYRNLGALSDDVTIDMFVWNSYRYLYAYIDEEYPKTLNSIQVNFPQFTMGVDNEHPYGIPPGQVEQGWAIVTGTSGPSGKVNFPTMQFTVNAEEVAPP